MSTRSSDKNSDLLCLCPQPWIVLGLRMRDRACHETELFLSWFPRDALHLQTFWKKERHFLLVAVFQLRCRFFECAWAPIPRKLRCVNVSTSMGSRVLRMAEASSAIPDASKKRPLTCLACELHSKRWIDLPRGLKPTCSHQEKRRNRRKRKRKAEGGREGGTFNTFFKNENR